MSSLNNKLVASIAIFFFVGVGMGFGLGFITYEPQLSELRSSSTFDESIQIMDLEIDEEGYNTYVTGKAKNIGNTLIKALYVFAFQYDPDGLLLEMRYQRFDIIWPSESMSFEISLRTIEGQKFKVLAVGNYQV